MDQLDSHTETVKKYIHIGLRKKRWQYPQAIFNLANIAAFCRCDLNRSLVSVLARRCGDRRISIWFFVLHSIYVVFVYKLYRGSKNRNRYIYIYIQVIRQKQIVELLAYRLNSGRISIEIIYTEKCIQTRLAICLNITITACFK